MMRHKLKSVAVAATSRAAVGCVSTGVLTVVRLVNGVRSQAVWMQSKPDEAHRNVMPDACDCHTRCCRDLVHDACSVFIALPRKT